MPALNSFNFFLVSTKQLTIVLIATSVVFAVFIGVAVVKMFKLKAENRTENLKKRKDSTFDRTRGLSERKGEKLKKRAYKSVH